MEPMEVNAGRFYCRPLRHDSRVDDAPVTAQILAEGTTNTADSLAQATDDLAQAAEFLIQATADWENDTSYRFAVAEQTNVEMLALATVTPAEDDRVTITVEPAGDPARVLPNDDQVLTKVTVADGVTAAENALRRWAEGFLGKKVD